MSLRKKVSPFKVNAFHNDQFIEITEKDLEGKWMLLCSIQQILVLFVQQN